MRTKIFLLIMLSMTIFQVKLFPLISSRIEGTVIDLEEHFPIPEAEIALFQCSMDEYGISCSVINHTKTTEKGTFRFDDILKGEYFVSVFKKGYAAFGPIFNYYKLFVTNSYSESMGGSWRCKKNDAVSRFEVNEGQIKHLVIKMEKEAVLIIKIPMKMPAGIDMSPVVFNRLTIKHHDFPDGETVYLGDSVPDYHSSYFKKGMVSVEISPYGYPLKKFEDILLQSGQTTTIEYLLDFSKDQIIHGFIRSKLSKEPIETVEIFLSDLITHKISARTITNSSGEFLLGGFNEGKYKIRFHSYTPEISFEEIIEIKINEKKEITREF